MLIVPAIYAIIVMKHWTIYLVSYEELGRTEYITGHNNVWLNMSTGIFVKLLVSTVWEHGGTIWSMPVNVILIQRGTWIEQ